MGAVMIDGCCGQGLLGRCILSSGVSGTPFPVPALLCTRIAVAHTRPTHGLRSLMQSRNKKFLAMGVMYPLLFVGYAALLSALIPGIKFECVTRCTLYSRLPPPPSSRRETLH
jgi:hypothetical protein